MNYGIVLVRKGDKLEVAGKPSLFSASRDLFKKTIAKGEGDEVLLVSTSRGLERRRRIRPVEKPEKDKDKS